MWIGGAILLGSAVLFAYFLIEKRINQRRCLACGYSVAIDALPERCPRCGSTIAKPQDD